MAQAKPFLIWISTNIHAREVGLNHLLTEVSSFSASAAFAVTLECGQPIATAPVVKTQLQAAPEEIAAPYSVGHTREAALLLLTAGALYLCGLLAAFGLARIVLGPVSFASATALIEVWRRRAER